MSYEVVPYTSTNPTKEDAEQLRLLYCQLRSDILPNDRLIATGIRITIQRGSYIWVGKNNGIIVATGLLVPNFKPILAESFGSVEDMVTDKNHRGKICNGQSLAELIMQEIVDRASNLRLKYLQLTSAPYRIAANRLYRKFGFTLVASGKKKFYRLNLGAVDSILS